VITHRKEAGEAIRVQIDWRDRLQPGEGITACTYTFPAGITEGVSDILKQHTEVMVSGGTINTTYTIEAEITTDFGTRDQTLKRSFKVMVVDR